LYVLSPAAPEGSRAGLLPRSRGVDVTRSFDPDVLFGYGPRYCIGAALAKRQLYLTLSERFGRFPDVTLAEEPERDRNDHNAIVFERLILHTPI